jgi:hypothetical protein
LINRGITIKLPGKNRLGYHAMVMTGKYNTLEIIISKCPTEDIRVSSALAANTENVIIVTIFVTTK